MNCNYLVSYNKNEAGCFVNQWWLSWLYMNKPMKKWLCRFSRKLFKPTMIKWLTTIYCGFFLLFYHNLRRITRILSKTYPCFKKNDFVHITIPVYCILKQILSCSCQHFYVFTPLKDIKQRKKWMYEIIVILFLLKQYNIIKMSNTFCIAPINRLELFTGIRKWKKNLLISNKV